ncbi:hypothetical protein OAR45_04235 [Candidatus Pelagibacter sp.]|jgi:hypothetical protein|nr:hypothetical protein [Candidatus Pelagibacter sp.]|tara:strand:- start:231 stop:497 length:267 start_codon:yes stop_codon:yes gene_type:complete
MIYLVQLIVMALDPIIFLIVLILNFISLDKKKIIIYGIIGGLIAEIMVASMNVTRSFGDTIFLRIIAASLQSLLSFYIAKYFKNRKKS